jgi:TonB family protein
MSAVHQAVLLVVPALVGCASSAGRTPGDDPPRAVDTLIKSGTSELRIELDSARVDSLRRAGVFREAFVDEPPEVLLGPQLSYPEEARRQCITGRVIIQAIVGRDGRPEYGSVRVIQHVDPALDLAALDYVWHASFKPGKVHGVPVRTLVNVPIDFTIRRGC